MEHLGSFVLNQPCWSWNNWVVSIGLNWYPWSRGMGSDSSPSYHYLSCELWVLWWGHVGDFHSSLQFLFFSCPDISRWEQTRKQKQAHSVSVDGTGMWMRCPFTSGPVLAFWAAQRSGMLLSSWLELGPEEISKLREDDSELPKPHTLQIF